MKKLHLILLLVCICKLSYAQPHRSDNWYFGQMAGMKFSSGTPLAITNGILSTNEGCAAISDTSGNLLFYTDGVTIWNRNHIVMPNGTGLLGDPSSTQSAIIVTKPGSQTEHYVFTMDDMGGPDGFRYSIVDMTLLSGAGDVTPQKNIPVNTYMTEKLTSVQQLGANDFWIATHKWASDEFYVYNLTSTGLQPNPVISNVGLVHNDSIIQNSFGQMKFNVCGNKLAVAVSYQDTIEVFDFNNSTGVVSNPITLPIGFHTYGVEFSKNSNFLYASTYNSSATLVQFDLTSGNATTILASQTVLSNTPDIYGLQMANDGKIYVSRTVSNFLGVINSPEIPGINCNYVDNGVNLDPNGTGIYSMLGLPALVSSYLRSETFCNTTIAVDELTALNEEVKIFPNPSNGSFNLSVFKSNKDLILNILDDTGRLIKQLNITPNASTTFGELLTPGIYFVEVKSDKGNIYKRMVKF